MLPVGVLRVFSGTDEEKGGVSDVWGRGSIMSASRCGAEFTEQVVPRGRSTVPAGGRDREALQAWPLQTEMVQVFFRSSGWENLGYAKEI